MNEQVLELLRQAGGTLAAYLASWGDQGWLAGLILIIMLSSKELLRAHGGPRTGPWMQRLNHGIVPLLVVFVVALGARILSLPPGT